MERKVSEDERKEIDREKVIQEERRLNECCRASRLFPNNEILKAACRKSGIHYRVYAHLFRHTRATLLAQNVAQAPLSKQMGWTQGSQMTKVYVHLSDQQQDEAIIKGYQKEKAKESTDSGKNNPERTE